MFRFRWAMTRRDGFINNSFNDNKREEIILTIAKKSLLCAIESQLRFLRLLSKTMTKLMI